MLIGRFRFLWCFVRACVCEVFDKGGNDDVFAQ